MVRKSHAKQAVDLTNPELIRRVGRRLCALRIALGGIGREMTKGGMAALLGVERARYERWEKGDIAIPMHILERLRVRCGISLDSLIAGTVPGRTDMIPWDGYREGELTVGERARMVRRIMEPDAETAAKLMSVPVGTLLRWEENEIQPPVEKMTEFAHRFGVTLDFLYTGRLSGSLPVVVRALVRQYPELLDDETPADGIRLQAPQARRGAPDRNGTATNSGNTAQG